MAASLSLTFAKDRISKSLCSSTTGIAGKLDIVLRESEAAISPLKPILSSKDNLLGTVKSGLRILNKTVDGSDPLDSLM
jgi:hypothetical protein